MSNASLRLPIRQRSFTLAAQASAVRDKLLVADKAMFAKKKAHLVITYGFRSNSLQQELYRKINGKGKVAEVGGSFHETGMALDLSNWRDAQHFMIDAGFVGGCYGSRRLASPCVGSVSRSRLGAC